VRKIAQAGRPVLVGVDTASTSRCAHVPVRKTAQFRKFSGFSSQYQLMTYARFLAKSQAGVKKLVYNLVVEVVRADFSATSPRSMSNRPLPDGGPWDALPRRSEHQSNNLNPGPEIGWIQGTVQILRRQGNRSFRPAEGREHSVLQP
jgi:hypothetical protein